MSHQSESAPITEAFTPKSPFVESLESRWAQDKFVCVGLDPDPAKLPQSVLSSTERMGDSLFRFNREIVDATGGVAGFYKPNIAFYERFGAQGLQAFGNTIEYIHSKFPGVPVIGDVKRADIGNTNIGYAASLFDEFGVDAVTVNGYFGEEAMQPFLERTDKGIIVLARTSNKGAREFQNQEFFLTDEELFELSNGPAGKTESEALRVLETVKMFKGDFAELLGKEIKPEDFVDYTKVPLFLDVAMRVANHWNKNGNCAVVAGATAPAELGLIRRAVGDLPILIPGLGSQGGDREATVKNGKDSRGWGMIINSSSGIVHASSGEDFAERAREETIKLTQGINELRAA